MSGTLYFDMGRKTAAPGWAEPYGFIWWPLRGKKGGSENTMPGKAKTKRLVYSLRWVKATGEWALYLGGGNPIFAFHCSMGGKARALKRARQHARTNEPSQLRVYGKDGRIQFEHTYPRSSDPRPKAGSKRNRG